MAEISKTYENDFDSLTYAKNYVSTGKKEYQWYAEDFYHHLFKSVNNMENQSLIDVGCGPALRAPLIASRYGCRVYCADISKQNRDFLQNWLKNGHEAYDFTDQFKYVAQLEGKNDIEYLEERVKKSVKEVVFCNILAENPLHPLPFEQFDVVTSSLLLECFPNEEDYLKGAEGLASLIRPGGFLAFTSTLGGTKYIVGDHVLPLSSVDAGKATRAFTRAGLKVLQINQHFKETTRELSDIIVTSSRVRHQAMSITLLTKDIMTDDSKSALVSFIKCVDFAAKKHKTQRRKDPERTPYINHPIGVAKFLVDCKVYDPVVLEAAILHDTVEDTDTTFDEIEREFGEKIANIVYEVSDDKTLSKEQRKEMQIELAKDASTEAKLVKLADKLYNLKDLLRVTPVGWSPQRVQEYFVWAGKVVDNLRGTNAELEAELDEVFKKFRMISMEN
uniref:Guanosine-3',5'-bis(diphosphate) 3'-pyrophosphohydrolase MESH1 n=1 Tax=Strigamia maritima TaxID=126957 RepID=T1J3S4_STRMM